MLLSLGVDARLNRRGAYLYSVSGFSALLVIQNKTENKVILQKKISFHYFFCRMNPSNMELANMDVLSATL